MTTFIFGGFMREQVCIYMCPWPRIQGAMIDRHTLLVSYQTERGEPRGAHKKGEPWAERGDCIDCRACVAVCPTGIDIRDGPQLECIQCALCIDACNDIMNKVGRPKGLIAYDTMAAKEAKAQGLHEPGPLLRPRTVLYLSLIVFVSGIMLTALLMRSVLEINVIQDRNPPFVQLSDGSTRNTYAVKILNKLHEPRAFKLELRGISGAQLRIVDLEGGNAVINVRTDELRELRVLVTLPPEAAARLAGTITSFSLVIKDIASGLETVRLTKFHKRGDMQ